MSLDQNQPKTEVSPGIIASDELHLTNAQGKQEIWQAYDLKRPTALMLDPHTGITFTTSIPANKFMTAAHTAWVGTRHSRAEGHTLAIRLQIEEEDVDSEGKLKRFQKIGHTAPADAAKLAIEIDHLPRHLAHLMFLMSAEHAGQEKSTRYQKGFSGKPLAPIAPFLNPDIPQDISAEIEMQYQALGVEAQIAYSTARDLVHQAFAQFYQIDPTNKAQMDTLMSRVLDCARVFLQLGQDTGMSYVAGARELSRMIGILKAFPGNYYSHFAQQLENFLAPNKEVSEALGYSGDAAQLIRHTEPQPHSAESIQLLDHYLRTHTDFSSYVPGTSFAGNVDQRMIDIPSDVHAVYSLAAEYIWALYPQMNPIHILGWLGSQKPEITRDISSIMFNGMDVYHELSRIGSTTSMSLISDTTIGVNRDFVRHRGGGARFQPIPTWNGLPTNYATAINIINSGYVLPINLTQIEEFQHLIPIFNGLFQEYYSHLTQFVDKFHSSLGNDVDYGFILNLLPLGHRIPLWMHFNPGQAVFFPDRRVRPGGDNTYRELAWESNALLSEMNPLMAGLRFPESRKPDFRNREEFLDRA